jgi:hypothetical protein
VSSGLALRVEADRGGAGVANHDLGLVLGDVGALAVSLVGLHVEDVVVI